MNQFAVFEYPHKLRHRARANANLRAEPKLRMWHLRVEQFAQMRKRNHAECWASICHLRLSTYSLHHSTRRFPRHPQRLATANRHNYHTPHHQAVMETYRGMDHHRRKSVEVLSHAKVAG
jgi:hypothetical protein